MKTKRRENDFYPTPEFATKALLENVPIGGIVLEPCSGDGDIVRVLKKHPGIEHVTTNDLSWYRHAQYQEDATKQTIYDMADFDWIVTNPPFSHAYEILERAHKNAEYGVALLLRLSFLEPTYKRGPFLFETPPNKLLILPRISFTGDGKTDSTTCAWIIWDKSGESWIRVVPK